MFAVTSEAERIQTAHRFASAAGRWCTSLLTTAQCDMPPPLFAREHARTMFDLVTSIVLRPLLPTTPHTPATTEWPSRRVHLQGPIFRGSVLRRDRDISRCVADETVWIVVHDQNVVFAIEIHQSWCHPMSEFAPSVYIDSSPASSLHHRAPPALILGNRVNLGLLLERIHHLATASRLNIA